MELNCLRRDNEILRENSGAIGGAGVRPSTSSAAQNRQLSRELRVAAATAENNLRLQRNSFFFILSFNNFLI